MLTCFIWWRPPDIPDSTGVIDTGKPDLELIGWDLAPPKLRPHSSWKGVGLQFTVSCSCHGLSSISRWPGQSMALTLSWAPSALMTRVWDNRIGPGDSTVLLRVLFSWVSKCLRRLLYRAAIFTNNRLHQCSVSSSEHHCSLRTSCTLKGWRNVMGVCLSLDQGYAIKIGLVSLLAIFLLGWLLPLFSFSH